MSDALTTDERMLASDMAREWVRQDRANKPVEWLIERAMLAGKRAQQIAGAERDEAMEPDAPLKLAMRFHETYERLAPSFGYETRPETRVFDPESRNGHLMVAVCRALLAEKEGGR